MPVISESYFTGFFKEILGYFGSEIFDKIFIFLFGKNGILMKFIDKPFHFFEHTTFDVIPSSIPIFPESLFITSKGASRTMLMTLRFFE